MARRFIELQCLENTRIAGLLRILFVLERPRGNDAGEQLAFVDAFPALPIAAVVCDDDSPSLIDIVDLLDIIDGRLRFVRVVDLIAVVVGVTAPDIVLVHCNPLVGGKLAESIAGDVYAVVDVFHRESVIVVVLHGSLVFLPQRTV